MNRFTFANFSSAMILSSCSESEPENNPNTPDVPTPPDVEENGFVYRIDATRAGTEISPYIYGLNVDYDFSHSKGDYATMVRFGGNRTTAFNWENNASNAGADWRHSSDDYIARSMVKGSDGNKPGSVAATFVTNCLANNQTPLFTIPMCYSVAADKKGEVNDGDTSRWANNLARKNSPFQLTPDLTDKNVYADECVNYLTHVAGGPGKVLYCLDNEPDLWQSTHPRIVSSHVKCSDFLDRTIDFAEAIKDVDPLSTIFGFVSFGYSGFSSFSSAPDWNQIKSAGGYDWFIDYYLDRIARASASKGKNLVDVLDLHWYPEAKGDNRINQSTANTDKDKAARLQAPRSLWDDTYKENSWITNMSKYYLPLIPMLRKSIEKYNPGMKIAFTEFNYGGYEDITGTIALSEVLGIFGKYDIYAANHWGSPGSYGESAYMLYRNYDGKNSTFGNYCLVCNVNKSWQNTGIFASATNENMDEVHAIVTNKFADEKIDGKFVITSAKQYSRGVMYYVSEGSNEIKKGEEFAINGNSFRYSIPPMTVGHIIISQ